MQNFLNNKELERLRSGDIPARINNKPFVVAHQTVFVPVLNVSQKGWCLILGIDERSIMELSREEAKDIIDAYGMSPALKNEDGTLYELPGTPFLKEWGKNNKKTKRTCTSPSRRKR